MTYNPNQARNSKGAPMAGAWSADNQRGGAVPSPRDSISQELLGQWPIYSEDRGDYGHVSNDAVRQAAAQWGDINEAVEIAPGIVQVFCSGHGGLKISPERNALIPEPIRRRGGIYEEDCDFFIVQRSFPEAFRDSEAISEHLRGRKLEDIVSEADDSVRRWSPDGWEKATGREVQPGESRVRDEETFRHRFAQEHGSDFRTGSTTFSDSSKHLAGETVRIPLATARGESPAVAILPTEEYRRLRDEARANSAIGVPIPPKYYRTVTEPMTVSLEVIADTPVMLDTEKLGVRGKAMANKRYRWRHDDSVSTVAERVNQQGAIGRTISREDDKGKLSYWAQLADGSTVHVGADIYNALDVPASSSDEYTKLTAKAERVEQKRDREYSFEKRHELQAQSDAIYDRAEIERQRARNRGRIDYEQREERLLDVTEDNYYDIVDRTNTEAQQHLNALGKIRADAPKSLRQRLSDLQWFGRDRHMH